MRYLGIRKQAFELPRRFLQRFSLGSLCMFALALISELPVLFVRVVMLTLTIGIVDSLSGHPNQGPGWLWLGAAPTLWAMFALLTSVGSGWWWKQRSGGRSPSEREQRAYDDAVGLLQSNSSKRLPLPSNWFVIDTPLPDAAVQGETLMLSRGLMESDHLPAVIAHELGHLASPDGRIAAALNRLVLAKAVNLNSELLDIYLEQHSYPQPEHQPLSGDGLIRDFFQLARFTIRLLALARGGLGLRLIRPAWGLYWRRREYAADAYAAGIGQADELADFLETHALLHDHPVPYIWLTEHTHPPVELRIDLLRGNY
ncbi:MAG TPA: M48 family metalloprotease [Solirubrobacteraceae bacterium]|jgi:Zn-dependent protease with chaperone function|nr:M48 family metalloprotease [Solirubrobacteraceae bacterium]